MPKQKRGFAVMSPEKQREIASKGGKAAHAAGTAHEFSIEEARRAGQKGGRSHSREHMAELGKLGGKAARRSK
jgi:general stress protein YciG